MGGKLPTDDNLRGMSYNVHKTGWKDFLATHVEPMLDAGFMNAHFHMPFGARTWVKNPDTGQFEKKPGEEKMQFDAYLDAKKQEPTLVEDFVPAFKALLATYEPKDVSFSIYIGGLPNNKEQTELVGTGPPTDPSHDNWWKRAYQVLEPLLAAGFTTIGFDVAAAANIHDTEGALEIALQRALVDPEYRAHLYAANPVHKRLYDMLEAKDDVITPLIEALAYKYHDPDTGAMFVRDEYAHFLKDDNLRFTSLVKDPNHPKYEPLHMNPRDMIGAIRLVTGDAAQDDATIKKIATYGHHFAINPYKILDPKGKKAGTHISLQAYVADLGLDDSSMLIHLFPDKRPDENMHGITYAITQHPKHGTLKKLREFLYLYTPHKGVTDRSEDSFIYSGSRYGIPMGAAKVTVKFEDH